MVARIPRSGTIPRVMQREIAARTGLSVIAAHVVLDRSGCLWVALDGSGMFWMALAGSWWLRMIPPFSNAVSVSPNKIRAFL